MAAAEKEVTKATLKEIKPFNDDKFLVTEFLFRCPIDYKVPKHNQKSIELSFKLVHGERACKDIDGLVVKNETTESILRQVSQHNIMVYLCGGPGDGNPPSRMPRLNEYFLERDYWILYPDYRGTGDSSPGEIPLALRNGDEQGALYMIKQLGQRNIVRDLEAVRAVLCDGAKWSICAQSYGGWITYSYLSFSGSGLKRVCINAGAAPIHYSPEHVHQQLARNVVERNELYYSLYPDDVDRVKTIAIWLARQNCGKGIKIPGWGILTPQQFLCLGRNLSSEARYPQLHQLFKKMAEDIKGPPDDGSPVSLAADTIELLKATDSWRFDRRPLYAVLNESQYLRNTTETTNWVAQHVAAQPIVFMPEADIKAQYSDYIQATTECDAGDEPKDEPKDQPMVQPKVQPQPESDGKPKYEPKSYFWWVNDKASEFEPKARACQKLYMSGEMIYQFFFDNYEALRPFKKVAMKFAAATLLEDPYDFAQITTNRVPVTVVGGSADIIVDRGLGCKTWAGTGSVRACELEGLEHGAIRSDTNLMLNAHMDLWKLD
ncbi:Alpha/Beta hydrolase protein [Camillea tinctor]|nr:Alpha/Beta hydrolase protein [Camillea tinctor]